MAPCRSNKTRNTNNKGKSPCNKNANNNKKSIPKSGVYIVNSIKSVRVTDKGCIEYLVRWEGYSKHANRWITSELILDKGLITEFLVGNVHVPQTCINDEIQLKDYLQNSKSTTAPEDSKTNSQLVGEPAQVTASQQNRESHCKHDEIERLERMVQNVVEQAKSRLSELDAQVEKSVNELCDRMVRNVIPDIVEQAVMTRLSELDSQVEKSVNLLFERMVHLNLPHIVNDRVKTELCKVDGMVNEALLTHEKSVLDRIPDEVANSLINLGSDVLRNKIKEFIINDIKQNKNLKSTIRAAIVRESTDYYSNVWCTKR